MSNCNCKNRHRRQVSHPEGSDTQHTSRRPNSNKVERDGWIWVSSKSQCMPRTRHRGTLRLSQTVRRTAVDERVASVFEAEARYRIGCVGEDRRVGGHAELDPRVKTYGGDRRLPSAAGPGGLHAVSGDGGRSVREAVPSSWVCAPSGGVWEPARSAWAPELHSKMTAARSIAGPAMLRPASWWRPANRGGPRDSCSARSSATWSAGAISGTLLERNGA